MMMMMMMMMMTMIIYDVGLGSACEVKAHLGLEQAKNMTWSVIYSSSVMTSDCVLCF